MAPEAREGQVKPGMTTLVVDHVWTELANGSEHRPKHPELEYGLPKPWVLEAEKPHSILQTSDMRCRNVSREQKEHLGVLCEAIGQLHAVFPKSVRNQGDPQTAS